jgi:hypothetical protein
MKDQRDREKERENERQRDREKREDEREIIKKKNQHCATATSLRLAKL